MMPACSRGVFGGGVRSSAGTVSRQIACIKREPLNLKGNF